MIVASLVVEGPQLVCLSIGGKVKYCYVRSATTSCGLVGGRMTVASLVVEGPQLVCLSVHGTQVVILASMDH